MKTIPIVFNGNDMMKLKKMKKDLTWRQLILKKWKEQKNILTMRLSHIRLSTKGDDLKDDAGMMQG